MLIPYVQISEYDRKWVDVLISICLVSCTMRQDSARQLKAKLLRNTRLRTVATRATLPREALVTASALPPDPKPTAIALGICRSGKQWQLAVRLHHAFPGAESVVDKIRDEAKGELDVRVVGRVRKQVPWHQKRTRPLQIGGSIGHVKITAGTLGAFVTRNGRNDLILSNNHVLANENDAKRNDAILQPGKFDGGRSPKDRVAHLDRFVRLSKSKANLVDCATASLEDEMEYYSSWLQGLGPISGVRAAPLGEDEPVFKLGRTTGKTEGRISAIEVDDLEVGFDIGNLRFNDQLEIAPAASKPFSLGGDSGSLIVDSDLRAVGLLFAGNDSDATYANPIQAVLDELDANLVF